ncbi:MAG: hypothetical protein GPOALKHO_001873 [Sodalis sp.]|nr:MAG: hypothetical protein GPOALKHO_001873 [Sodalis sp.]
MWTQDQRPSFWKAGSSNFPNNAAAPSSVTCSVITDRDNLYAARGTSTALRKVSWLATVAIS